MAALSRHSFQHFVNLRAEFEADSMLQTLHDTINMSRGLPWHVEDGLILRGSRIFISPRSALLQMVLWQAHTASHEGIQKTL